MGVPHSRSPVCPRVSLVLLITFSRPRDHNHSATRYLHSDFTGPSQGQATHPVSSFNCSPPVPAGIWATSLSGLLLSRLDSSRFSSALVLSPSFHQYDCPPISLTCVRAYEAPVPGPPTTSMELNTIRRAVSYATH